MDVELQILKHLARDAQPTVTFIDKYCVGYIDETGDRKKGKRTDYVARQYLGSIGKVDSGIVSVNAYGIYENITFPLLFKVFKPKGTLKSGEKYQTKIELASEILKELIEFGFKIDLVLADSLYGEASSFIRTLDELKLSWIVAIRSNHGVWLPSHQRVRANRWYKFQRIFSHQTSQTRYIREIIFGKRSSRSYWEITLEPETLPENSTVFVMTNLPGNIKKSLGNLYGLRTWIEYAFRQDKQELGWTDYRFTNFPDIEKWWEIIFSAYLMISLNSPAFLSLNQSCPTETEIQPPLADFSSHQQWNPQTGWKNVLNNLRLIIQPTLALWLLSPWLDVFPNPYLLLGFHDLIHAMNQFQPFFPDG